MTVKGSAFALPGKNGKDGVSWTIGAGAPTQPAKDGDLYLDLNTGDVYKNQGQS